MVSVGIMSVVIAGLSVAVVNTVRSGEVEAKESMASMEDLMVQTAQQDYLIRAAPSYYFLNVPIRSFCSGSEKIPCLRQIDPATGKLVQVSNGGSGGIPSIFSFYKDASADLKKTKLAGMSASGDINDDISMMAGQAVDVSKLTAAKNNSYVYASWPLFDDKSEALPILVRRKNASILVHKKQFGASYENEAPNSMSLFEVTLTPAKAAELVKDLKDTLAVVYNINRPNQFVVQKITSAVNCPQDGTTKNYCKVTGNSISTLATDGLVAEDFANSVVLKIEPLPISTTLVQDGREGSRTHLANDMIPTSRSVNVSGNWFAATGSNDYLFPRGSFSLYDERPGYQGDLSYSPVDVKRIQHYLNANNSDTSLVVLPVDLGYIKLKQSPQFQNKYDLVVVSASHQEIILVPSVKQKDDPDSYVYINRRLGTGMIEVFIK